MANTSKTTSSRTMRNSRNIRNTRNGRNARNRVSESVFNSRLSAMFGEVRWVLYAIAAIVLAVMLFTWHASDPGWVSTSSSSVVQNKMGTFGAYTADIILYLMGFSAWWLVVLFVQRMWVGYKRLMRRWVLDPDVVLPRLHWEQILGYVMLILGSMGLETTQLRDFGSELPGQSGGLLGQIFAHLMQPMFGAVASVLLMAAMLFIGLSLFLNFSWLKFIENIGSIVNQLINGVLALVSARRDRKLGELALEARGEQVEAQKEQFGHDKPLKIEPAIKTFPISPQAEQAKQQNLFKPEPVIRTLQSTTIFNTKASTGSLSIPVDAVAASSEPNEPIIVFNTQSEAKDFELVIMDTDATTQSAPIRDRLRDTGEGASFATKTVAAQPLVQQTKDIQIPELDLLDAPPQQIETVSEEAIEYNSRLIEKKLSDFNVQVKVMSAQAGPVITRYEIEPASGVKGAQIVNLSKDLARALSLVRIRVVETIPGKNYMGIELPNPRRQIVRLSEIIGSQVYHNSASFLTMALGKDIAGNPVVADLAKMPHLLVAGTTGSGKSVGINAMILSLIYKADPFQVRLILVDPKMLEMSMYEGIGHLLAPVVTDMRQAANALNWCVGEMEKRYKLMSKVGVRNITGYNNKIREAAKKGQHIPNPFSLTPDQPEPLQTMPMIVVVIDELADLMMVAGKKIEELIARLAQKARAAGIHLILATQRPSVDVITGLIKANIPTRIAFQVSSKIDSRTILDQMGAESLLGQGDMLFMPPGSGIPQRVHGAFVSDDEIHRVVDFLKSLGEPDYVDGVLEGTVPGETGDGVGSITGFTDNESDPLYDQAVEVVLRTRKASISSVQRQLRVGYNRAARLLEQMERSGIVSPMQSNNNREILVPTDNSVD